MAEPFTDEEIEGLKQIKISRSVEIIAFGDERISYARFLATIERLKKDAEITDDLEKGVIASAVTHEKLQDAEVEIERLRKALEKIKSGDVRNGWEMLEIARQALDEGKE